MTKEEKILLVKDLGQRILYGVKFKLTVTFYTITGIDLTTVEDGEWQGWDYVVMAKGIAPVEIKYVKPYLRPMSSMTEKEKKELLNLLFDKEAKYFYIDEEGTIDGKTFDLMKDGLNYPTFCPVNIVLYTDWLNEHHFDYRGLIEKGLALEAPRNMYIF